MTSATAAPASAGRPRSRLVAILLYGRALTLGITRSQCILRRPLLIMGFWTAVAAADATWLLLF